MIPRPLTRKVLTSLSVFSFGVIAFSLTIPWSAQAEKRNAQSGEIELQFHDEKKEDPYLITKSSIIEKLTTFDNNLKNLDFVTPPPMFNEEELTFLASTHLYCTLREGVCTLIPYTLFEMDLIRSSKKEKKSCPNLVRFWKQWIGADMEKRVGLNLKVTHYNKRSKYTSEIRPQLLNCSKTAATLLSRSKDTDAWLKERYQPDKEKTKLPTELIQYIEALHDPKRNEGRKFNIYRETGVRR